MSTTLLTLVALIIASTSLSQAQTTTEIKSTQTLQVDPLNGALIINAVDTFSQFETNRKYNSRSLFKGLYGTGWCSPLDIKLQIKSATTIDLYICSQDPITLTFNHERARFEARTLWLDRRGVRGYRLFDETSHNGKMTQTDFDTTGRPIQIDRTEIRYLTSNADESSIALKNPDSNLSLILTLTDHHITKANLTHSKSVTYTYQQDTLIKVQTPNSEFKYQYDDNGNLTRTNEIQPPRTVASSNSAAFAAADITYANDLVTQVESANCTQKLTYTTPQDQDIHVNSVTVQTTCLNLPTYKKIYEYHFHLGTNETHILDQVKIKGDHT